METTKEAIALMLQFMPKKAEGAMSLEEWMDYVDRVEAKLVTSGEIDDCSVKHRFFPGMYVRECFLPMGMLGVTNIHNTEHPFTVLEGIIKVRSNEGTKEIRAPYFGRTTPMTRRILFAETDTRWLTFHVTNLTDPAEIMKSILFPRTNPLLSDSQLLMIREHVTQTNILK